MSPSHLKFFPTENSDPIIKKRSEAVEELNKEIDRLAPKGSLGEGGAEHLRGVTQKFINNEDAENQFLTDLGTITERTKLFDCMLNVADRHIECLLPQEPEQALFKQACETVLSTIQNLEKLEAQKKDSSMTSYIKIQITPEQSGHVRAIMADLIRDPKTCEQSFKQSQAFKDVSGGIIYAYLLNMLGHAAKLVGHPKGKEWTELATNKIALIGAVDAIQKNTP